MKSAVAASAPSGQTATRPPPERPGERPIVAGKIGGTLLCLYVLGVAFRIDGCYHPDPQPRDELRAAGPQVGERFPAFALADVSGARITLADLAGNPSVILFVPSVDWSPPSKARLLDLAETLDGRKDVRVAVVITAAQATPRALAFVREQHIPFYYLVDDAEFTKAIGLLMDAPDKTPAARPATFVLDANGVVRLRDVRGDPRTWLAGTTILEAVAGRMAASPPGERAP